MDQSNYVFEYIFRQHDDDKENNNIDYNDLQLDNLRPQPGFKYYQNHDFHKLSQILANNETLSILHTNICSLERNTEKVETLIRNLEFNLDSIAVSETWTSSSGENIKPRVLEGYQT